MIAFQIVCLTISGIALALAARLARARARGARG